MVCVLGARLIGVGVAAPYSEDMPAAVITAEPFWDELVDRAVTRAAEWNVPASDLFAGGSGGSGEPGGLAGPEVAEFTRRLLELVLSDDDAVTAALELKRLAPEAPATMRTPDRLLLRAGGAVSLGLPWAVMPVAKRWLRDRLSHLVLATKSPATVTEALRRITEAGVTAVVRPLGDPVLGPASVAREVDRLVALAALPSVTHLVVDPARLVPGGSDWSADADVVDAARLLRPVLDAAEKHHTTVLLEPTCVRWARLIPAILELALADSALDRVRVGVGFLAELPESREFYSQVSRWAMRRVADGGAPVEAVIGVGRVAARERGEAMRAGLPVPVVEGDEAVTAQLLGLIELALHAGRAVALRPVIATEDPLLIAATVEAAAKLGASDLFSVRLRAGVAPGLASSLVGAVPELRVCLPVTHPREYGGAIDLLVPLALEAAAAATAAAEVADAAVAAEPEAAAGPNESGEPAAPAETAQATAVEAAFRAAAVRASGNPQTSHRTQSRSREWDPSELDSALFYRAPDEPARFDTGGLTAAVLGLTRGETGEIGLTEMAPARAIPVVSESGFANEPDTDASRTENRDWARRLVALAREDVAARDDRAAREATPDHAGSTPDDSDAVRVAGHLDGNEAHDTIALSRAELDPARTATEALASSARWRAMGHGQRAIHLRRLALGAVAARDRLLRTLVADTGAPVPEIDAEIGRIVDAARYTGQLAEGLAAVRGATFTPEALALVTGDAWAGLAAQAEAVLAALGAGSGVLWAAPAQLAASARALLEEWEAAGLPVGSLTLEILTYPEHLTEVAAASAVDRAIVLGDRAEATALAHRRPDLRVEGRFRARGSVIVSPTAELASAVRDVIASAFTGPVLSRANSVIVVGSVGRARRFREALIDAVRGLRIGDTSRAAEATAGGEGPEPCPIAITVGPMPAPLTPAQLHALTDPDHLVLAPERLSADGRLWRPGVRTGVSAESPFWVEASGLPVIGLTHVRTLGEAIRHQNAPGSGAVAGLQATAAGEIATWLARAEAATLALNRPTTDVRVERQPVGGWNDAVMGLPPLAAGPNRLVTLGAWQPRPGTPSSTLHLRGLTPEVAALIETLQPELEYGEFDELRRAALADSLTWRTTFAPDRDVAGLGVERNLLRYHPVAAQVRLSEGARVVELARVLAAALLVRAAVTVSTGEVLPAALTGFLEKRGIEVSLERDDDWLERVAVTGLVPAARLRLIGGDAARTAEWFGGRDRVVMWAEPVTMAGPVEILSLVREQAVSARAQRHGVAVPVRGLDSP